mgnify:CR=1 FL=1|tara:strand:+ start:1207 stop:1383 length:177 start_codon:yes stop_codon:yes gene_type:complete
MISVVEKQYFNSEWLNNYIVTLDNNSVIIVPHDTSNTDYQAIQQWIADGGTVIDNPPE